MNVANIEYSVEGDTVYYYEHAAVITRFDPIEDLIGIEFCQKGMIPPVMMVESKHLKTIDGAAVINLHLKCPKCAVPWKETILARFTVYDCPSCGLKKEKVC